MSGACGEDAVADRAQTQRAPQAAVHDTECCGPTLGSMGIFIADGLSQAGVMEQAYTTAVAGRSIVGRRLSRATAG